MRDRLHEWMEIVAPWFLGLAFFLLFLGAYFSERSSDRDAARKADAFWDHELPGRSVSVARSGRTPVAVWHDERGACSAEVVYGGDPYSPYPVALRNVQCEAQP